MTFDRNKRVHYDAGPDLTPLVDVVMVILIFLMMVGKFGGAERYLSSSVPITSPNGTSAAADPNLVPKEPITVTIVPNPPSGYRAYVANSNTGDDAELTKLLAGLRDGMIKAGRKADDIQVFLKPSRQVRYDNVVTVYAAVLKAGLSKIGFQTAE